MDKKKYTAIILSAGTGSRMKSNMPKQYMELLGQPVIYYSIKAFEDSPVDEIVIVCSADYIEYFRHSIIEKYGFKKVKAIVQGGKERYNSVYEGLKAANGTDYVLIHDGARPLVDNEIIVRSMHTVEKEKACVAGMPVKDTIKVSDELGYSANTPDRKSLWQIQTPQCFEYDLLAQSYDKLFSDMSFITEPTACLMFDLNNLKNANDTLGHSAGDQLIASFARVLRNVIPAKDFVGRYGGDEFVVILYNITENTVNGLLTQLHNEVMQFNRGGNNIPISYAQGWAVSTDYTDCTLRTLFDKADHFMYTNKVRVKSE